MKHGIMMPSEWRNTDLEPGILREVVAGSGRVIFWLPRKSDRSGRYWDRIACVANAQPISNRGLIGYPATLVPTRKQPGVLGRFFSRFGKGFDRETWLLPNEIAVDQCGRPETGLLLVCPSEAGTPLDIELIKNRWPNLLRCDRIGKDLFLVSVPAETAGTSKHPVGESTFPSAAVAPPDAHPRPQAERFLQAARAGNDSRRIVAALIDLAVICSREGEKQKAVGHLEEAIALARQTGDRAGKSDALGNYAMDLLAIGQPQRAFQAIEEQLNDARAAKDPYEEKNALDILGYAHSFMKNPAAANQSYEPALKLAKQLGDRKHEANLHWYLAIHHADQGQRDAAIANGQAAIEIWSQSGDPQADTFVEHLRKYQEGQAFAAAVQPKPGGYLAGISGAEEYAAGVETPPTAEPAGLLRRAMTLARAMAKYVGSGMKTVSANDQRSRLEICNRCEHHTGIRCRVCGCFTGVKTWLPHEQCPMKKW